MTDRALFVLCDFPDARNAALTRAEAQSFCDSTLRDWFAEVSYGEVDLACEVQEWVTLPMSARAFADAVNAYQLLPLAEAAVALLDPALDFAAYRHLVIFAPWPYNGIGGMQQTYAVRVPTGASVTYQVAFVQDRNSPRLVPTFDLDKQSTVRHEFGHAYGAAHDNAINCPVGGLALPAGGTASCNTALYGNVYSAMGPPDSAGHPSAENKARCGWLAPRDLTGTVDPVSLLLRPIEVAADAISWQRSIGKTFYVECRQPIGADAVFANPYGRYPDVFNGVLISMQDGYGNPAVIDTSPSYVPGTYTGVDLTYNSVALLPGQVFTDAATGFRVECHSVSLAGAQITVTPGVADLTAPLVTLLAPINNPPPYVYPYPSINVSGNVPFAVSAAADVAEVVYNIGTRKVSTRAPFDLAWDSRSAPNGPVNCYAQAFDAAGNSGRTPNITINISNEVVVEPPPPPPPPVVVKVTIDSPSAATVRVGSTVQLAATTDPPTPVTWTASLGTLNGSVWTAPRQPNQYCRITATAGGASAAKMVITKK